LKLGSSSSGRTALLLQVVEVREEKSLAFNQFVAMYIVV